MSYYLDKEIHLNNVRLIRYLLGGNENIHKIKNKIMDEENDYLKSDVEIWDRENNTGQSAGICPNCGSKIYQSTYTDFCMCGEHDMSY